MTNQVADNNSLANSKDKIVDNPSPAVRDLRLGVDGGAMAVITFLGTGTSSGVPMIACECEVCTSSNKKDNRLRSSILVQSENTSFVIDTTPDFRYQMLREKVKELDAVVYTHSHKDHVAGLDDIRAFNYFQNKPIDIFATLATQEALKQEFSYAFADKKYPGIPELKMHIINTEAFTVGDILVTPVPLLHLHMPVLGFRIKDFTYITDANFISEESKAKIKGSKILILNALRKEKHISHFSLQEAINLSNELGAEQTYFTHLSHQMGLHEVINEELPVGKHLAYDGLSFEV